MNFTYWYCRLSTRRFLKHRCFLNLLLLLIIVPFFIYVQEPFWYCGRDRGRCLHSRSIPPGPSLPPVLKLVAAKDDQPGGPLHRLSIVRHSFRLSSLHLGPVQRRAGLHSYKETNRLSQDHSQAVERLPPSWTQHRATEVHLARRRRKVHIQVPVWGRRAGSGH